MTTNKYAIFCLTGLVCCVGFGQRKEVALNGKVVCDGNAVADVQIMNLVSEKTAVSNADGTFSISAKEDDLLIFSNPSYEYKRKSIASEDISKAFVEIKLVKKATELDEVVVNKSISAEKLGYGDMKKMSVAERRQRETGGIGKQMLDDFLNYGGIPIGAIINQITGRTKTMRKYVRTEKNEAVFEKISLLYDDSHFVEHLKIAPDYVDGFKYYLAEDKDFGLVLDTKNTNAIHVEMAARALKFNELIALETK